MKNLRRVLILCTVLGLLGWWHYRRPASPVDDLPAVSFTTLQPFEAPSDAGFELADRVRDIRGVTAVTYNASSGLLVVAHTAVLSGENLKKQVATVTRSAPKEKVFAASGPQCPVPASFLVHLPFYFLGFSIGCGSLWLVLGFRKSTV